MLVQRRRAADECALRQGAVSSVSSQARSRCAPTWSSAGPGAPGGLLIPAATSAWHDAHWAWNSTWPAASTAGFPAGTGVGCRPAGSEMVPVGAAVRALGVLVARTTVVMSEAAVVVVVTLPVAAGAAFCEPPQPATPMLTMSANPSANGRRTLCPMPSFIDARQASLQGTSVALRPPSPEFHGQV